MNPVKYSIKELERLTGIKAHTIRMWEKRFGIIMPERTSTNIRYYSDNNLQKLLNISILNKNGFKISLISEMTSDEIKSEVERISDSLSGLDANINALIIAAIDMREEEIDKILNSSILRIGFERTFCELVFPLFVKITIFWQVGRINSCQERFISNLVRQKLLVAIDGLVGQTNPGHRNFLMFMPAGEYDELGLLFANYLVRKAGHEVAYLGPSVPLEHLQRMSYHTKFNELLLNIYHPQDEKEHKEYLSLLRQIFPYHRVHVIFSGEQPPVNSGDITNIQQYSSFTHFSSMLEQL